MEELNIRALLLSRLCGAKELCLGWQAPSESTKQMDRAYISFAHCVLFSPPKLQPLPTESTETWEDGLRPRSFLMAILDCALFGGEGTSAVHKQPFKISNRMFLLSKTSKGFPLHSLESSRFISSLTGLSIIWLQPTLQPSTALLSSHLSSTFLNSLNVITVPCMFNMCMYSFIPYLSNTSCARRIKTDMI